MSEGKPLVKSDISPLNNFLVISHLLMENSFTKIFRDFLVRFDMEMR